MTSNAERRLLKDLKKMHEDATQDTISATPSGDSLFHWEAVIFGPEDTIWDGGCFSLTIEFTEEYPNKAPKVKFITKMFHPNIYTDGSICLDILQHMWSPVYDVSSILTSIQSLLTDPNVNSPANNTAAVMYGQNYQEYCSRVRQVVEQSQNDVGDDDDDDDEEAESGNADEVNADVVVEAENEASHVSAARSQAEASLAAAAEASLAEEEGSMAAAAQHAREREASAEEESKREEDDFEENEGTMNVDD